HIAEFPTTIEAARLSRERELRIVCGAPNVMRGGSHSGNVGALELVRNALCDGLCSDYLPYSMIESVPILVKEGACTLPRAVRLVTRGPAVSVGLEDRGLIAKGMRGDLVLARIGERTAQVLAVLRARHGNDEQGRARRNHRSGRRWHTNPPHGRARRSSGA
ncbi:MAG: hypothetical protein EBT46_06120, partial [Actinobacteria bacterium]|nr:hypothetical protein [Actinomycetota bacterium]